MSNQLQGTAGPLIVRDAPGPGTFQRGTLVFPATVNTADPAGLTDGNTAMLSVDASGRLRIVLGGPAPAGTVTVLPFQADSIGVTGRAVGPGAGTVIATITPAAGTWDVEVFAHFDAGAPAAAEINNMQFRDNGAVVSVLSVLPVANVYSPSRRFMVVVAGGTAIDVQAVGAATAGVGYNAEITAVRVA